MEVRFEEINSICALMPRTNLVHGMLISWMREHFSSAAAIEEPTLQNRLWNLDISQSGIVIDSVYRWNPSTTETRPAVLLKRGPWKIMNYGIDSGRLMGSSSSSGYDQYVTFIQGTHTLFCVAGAPAECEILGTEVFRELVEFGPKFRIHFKLHRFQVMEVGEVSILEEARQNFVMPITVGYAAQEAWEVTQYAPPLKSIKLSAFLP